MPRTTRRLVRLSALLLALATAARVPAGPASGVPFGPEAPAAPAPARPHHLLLARAGADRWHAAGYRGKGVTVAVLDTGFRGWRAHLGGALPAHVTTRSFRRDGDLEAVDSLHGVMCAEVVHALAPEADLLLANWGPGRADQFLAAVRWARGQGARVLTVSVIMPSWSDGRGGGAVHRDLTRLLGTGDTPPGLLCFASAGNTADRHWGGRFTNDGRGWHGWEPGRRENPLIPWGGQEVAVELYGRPGADYELSVVEAGTGRVAGQAATRPGPEDRLSAAVRFRPESGRPYAVRVRHVGGVAGEFHLVTTFSTLGCTTPGANVCFPGDGTEVVAVGAVDEAGHRQPYSARGTNLPWPKPDLAAVVPVASACRDQPFGGTSAAAPQAAALAALCLSRHPDWTADRTRAALRSAALDLGPPGPDPETSYGLIHLPDE